MRALRCGPRSSAQVHSCTVTLTSPTSCGANALNIAGTPTRNGAVYTSTSTLPALGANRNRGSPLVSTKRVPSRSTPSPATSYVRGGRPSVLALPETEKLNNRSAPRSSSTTTFSYSPAEPSVTGWSSRSSTTSSLALISIAVCPLILSTAAVTSGRFDATT